MEGEEISGMINLFVTVLNMSIKASVCILVIISVRLLLSRAPKIFSYLLWAVVLIRLICPVGLTTGFGVIPGTPVIGTDPWSESQVEAENNYMPQEQVTNAKDQPAGTQGQEAEEKAWTDQGEAGVPGYDADSASYYYEDERNERFFLAVPEKILKIMAAIWVGVVLVLVLYTALRYRYFLHSLRSQKIQTPFVAGIFHPNIYLPEGLDQTQRQLVLEHENTHIRRFDHVIKPIAYLVCCIHWFNPLVWAAFWLMEGDMESSCDEAVLRKIGYDKRKDYAKTLLCLAGEGRKAGYPIAFGENNVKSRIKRVVKMKKTGVGICTAAAVVACLAAVFLLVDAAEDGGPHSAQASSDDGIVILPEEKISEKVVASAAPTAPSEDEDEQDVEDGAGQAALEEYVTPDMIDSDSIQEAGGGQEQDAVDYTYIPEGQAGDETIMNYNPDRPRDQFEVLLLPETDGAVTDEEILFSCPVEYERISDGFGTRVHPVTGEEKLHSGIDFAADKGTPVTAAADGIVVKTGEDTACGHYVIILHGNGDATYYSCLDEILVEEGQQVSRGEQIATVGRTGTSTGPHLHFAVSRDGKYIKPLFADGGDYSVLQSP
ncbi:MAG: M56 family metallopeptidase [Bacillota bacterium]|nr:M56 family metallopeptidase [Bacillota bacterium]